MQANYWVNQSHFLMRNFNGVSAAVVGLSVEGLDSVRFFLSENAVVTCCDRRTEAELGETYDRLRKQKVSFQLGNDYLHGLSRFDVVVRTPGMSLDTPEFASYRGTLTSQTKLFFDLCPAPIIGVTGTKGKGTTSSLIAAILKASGKTVYLGGNVGTPLLSLVRSMQENDWVVYELSSFQLEDLTRSPHIAVVLPITQDHLANIDPLATNYHKTRKDYVDAKTSIVRYQQPQDTAVVNVDNQMSRSFGDMTKGSVFGVSRQRTDVDAYVDNHNSYIRWQNKRYRICRAKEIKLRGDHNLENIAAASLVGRMTGCTVASIKKSVREFSGLPHRLRLVQVKSGISYYDDSFSTTPETAIAAIASFEAPIILIAGGSEKGSDFTELGQVIAHSCVKALIAIGQMSGRIVTAAKQAGYTGVTITGCRSMREIVYRARQVAERGDIVLLSPACASFDMFTNYKERGDQFIYEVTQCT